MEHQFTDDAIVRPMKGKHPPNLGNASIMVCSRPDLTLVCENLGLDTDVYRSLMLSRLYTGGNGDAPWSAAGPIVGAPYAAMVMESLVAWGAANIIFFGWCGAVSPNVSIGDIILVSGAFSDEGTSGQYEARSRDSAVPSSSELTGRLAIALENQCLPYHKGFIWTTDGIFRETPEKVKDYRDMGALAVEMELSALFTVGRFRNVNTAGIVVVSDDISTFQWRRGFKDERFISSRHGVARAIGDVCRKTETD